MKGWKKGKESKIDCYHLVHKNEWPFAWKKEITAFYRNDVMLLTTHNNNYQPHRQYRQDSVILWRKIRQVVREFVRIDVRFMQMDLMGARLWCPSFSPQEKNMAKKATTCEKKKSHHHRFCSFFWFFGWISILLMQNREEISAKFGRIPLLDQPKGKIL